jgi:acyl-CoA reductase-like NAD-dependent aldehyde dehydrogenase
MPVATKRLGVLKTYKLFVGGKFPRGESGRYLTARSPDGKNVLANFCHASRKDFRDAVVAARKAFPGWAKNSAYLRGQILYRVAEMLENRAQELVEEVRRSIGYRLNETLNEVTQTIGRLVHYAGWTDKYARLFSSVNPVASSHFNFTIPEPTGVVVAVCPDAPALLPLISLIAPIILSGNAVVVLASETMPLPAITFGEILATSDLPGGVVNILTGTRAELVPHIASHMDVNAVVDANPDVEFSTQLEAGTATNLKRYAARDLTPREWFSNKAADPYWILDTVEFKTAWHPIGI